MSVGTKVKIPVQGFTYPVRAHFLEDFLETSGYRLTAYNQIDDYGEEKTWKMQKQAQLKKRKSPISSAVEVRKKFVILHYILCIFSG